MRIISGTGHRPPKLGGYSDVVFNNLVELCELFIEIKSPDKIISGVALGFDLALATASVNKKIPFIAAIPCRNQSYRWNKEDQLKYKDLLNKSYDQKIISENYTNTCMQERNVWMIDNSNEVVALFDGSSGGTKNCILYAETKNVPIFNMWSIWKENYL